MKQKILQYLSAVLIGAMIGGGISYAQSANSFNQIRRQSVEDIATNYQIRLDYGARTDSNPVYVGYAKRGFATSDDVWMIYEFTYDASARITLKQTAIDDAWDDRATATYQ